jgi:hypothetical protein
VQDERWVGRPILLVGATILVSACEPEADTAAAGRVQTERSSQSSVAPTGESQTSQVEPVTVPPIVNEIEPRLIDRCVEYVQFQAYVGEAESSATWDRAGQSADGLRTECQVLALADEAMVREMGIEMDRLNEYFAAADAASTTTIPTTSTTTTTPPLPPAPPTTQQVAVPPAPALDAGCDPNYTGCVPIASDVDCAGGSGNGPAYVRGPVQVVGRDIYELDRDGDGVGCE